MSSALRSPSFKRSPTINNAAAAAVANTPSFKRSPTINTAAVAGVPLTPKPRGFIGKTFDAAVDNPWTTASILGGLGVGTWMAADPNSSNKLGNLGSGIGGLLGGSVSGLFGGLFNNPYMIASSCSLCCGGSVALVLAVVMMK